MDISDRNPVKDRMIYDAGYQAACDGWGWGHNPYNSNSYEWVVWQEGWNDYFN